MAAARNIDEGQSVDISDEDGARDPEENTDGLDVKKGTENLLKAENNKQKGGRNKRKARNRTKSSRRKNEELQEKRKICKTPKTDLEDDQQWLAKKSVRYNIQQTYILSKQLIS